MSTESESPKDEPQQHSISDEIKALQVTRHLIEVASRGGLGDARQLWEMGADVHQEDRNGHTALLRAVSCSHVDVVRLLIGKGRSNINHRDKQKRTALHHAILSRDPINKEHIVDLLLKKGIEATARDADGKTALDLALGAQDQKKLQRHLKKGFVKGPSSKSRDRKPTVRKPASDTAAATACKGYSATLAEFFFDGIEEGHNFQQPSIYELLYGSRTPSSILEDGRADERNKNKKPTCWWYHLPVNNVRYPQYQGRQILMKCLQMVWIDDLFAKMDIIEDSVDLY